MIGCDTDSDQTSPVPVIDSRSTVLSWNMFVGVRMWVDRCKFVVCVSLELELLLEVGMNQYLQVFYVVVSFTFSEY